MASVFLAEALLPEGWASNVRLVIEAGLIASVQPNAAAAPGEDRHAIGIPGLANLHSHAFQRGMAGLSEVRGPAADSFWTWREVMYRFLGAMTPDDVEVISAQAYVEMLEGGFTRVGEFHYLHHDPTGRPYAALAEMAQRVGAAAAQTGIGLTLLPVFYAHGGFGGLPPSPGQRRFITDLDGFARLLEASQRVVAALDGSVIGVAPHSLRAVTPDELAAVISLAPGGPVHIHVAEQVREVEDCRAWSGARPVEWLLDHAAVDERWCLIHVTHMTPAETIRLAGAGATAGLCPMTEANLGDGIFSGVDWVAANGRYGVGTDSNVAADAAQELRQLEYAQRLRQRGRNLMAGQPSVSTGRALFTAALQGGAVALGAGPSGLQAGTAADLVTLRAGHPSFVHRRGDLLLDGWIFGAGQGVIDCVWARGCKQVADGRHTARQATAARYAKTMRRLLAS